MARRYQPNSPPEIEPLTWAAAGCGDRYTAGQRREYYGSPNIKDPGTSKSLHTPNVNPFKVRGSK